MVVAGVKYLGMIGWLAKIFVQTSCTITTNQYCVPRSSATSSRWTVCCLRMWICGLFPCQWQSAACLFSTAVAVAAASRQQSAHSELVTCDHIISFSGGVYRDLPEIMWQPPMNLNQLHGEDLCNEVLLERKNCVLWLGLPHGSWRGLLGVWCRSPTSCSQPICDHDDRGYHYTPWWQSEKQLHKSLKIRDINDHV